MWLRLGTKAIHAICPQLNLVQSTRIQLLQEWRQTVGADRQAERLTGRDLANIGNQCQSPTHTGGCSAGPLSPNSELKAIGQKNGDRKESGKKKKASTTGHAAVSHRTERLSASLAG